MSNRKLLCREIRKLTSPRVWTETFVVVNFLHSFLCFVTLTFRSLFKIIFFRFLWKPSLKAKWLIAKLHLQQGVIKIGESCAKKYPTPKLFTFLFVLYFESWGNGGEHNGVHYRRRRKSFVEDLTITIGFLCKWVCKVVESTPLKTTTK